MELSALVFMAVSWGVALALQLFCIYMLATHPQARNAMGKRRESRGTPKDPEQVGG